MTLTRIFTAALLSALGMAAFSLYAWFQLPEGALVAIHWNIAGNVDNSTTKTTALLAIPLVTLALAGFLKALPYFEPRRKNFEQSPKLIGATWIGVILVMWAAQFIIVGTALGWDVNIFLVLKVALGAMMMLTGNYAAKSKSMFLIGFRTPWTLSSETVWKKTHSLFGKLFMVAGLILIVLPLSAFPVETFGLIMIALIMAPILVCLVYSWIVWRGEQNEKP